MRQYWCVDGVTRTSDRVPDDAVAFNLGASCLHCEGARIVFIDWECESFGCSKGGSHKGIPEKQMTVTEYGQLSIDNHPNKGSRTLLSGDVVTDRTSPRETDPMP